MIKVGTLLSRTMNYDGNTMMTQKMMLFVIMDMLIDLERL